MARSRWKLKYFSKSIWSKIFFLKTNRFLQRYKRDFYDRSSNIPNCFSLMGTKVHKGKDFRRLFLHNFNKGYKFGEFGYTRKPFHYPLKKKKR